MTVAMSEHNESKRIIVNSIVFLILLFPFVQQRTMQEFPLWFKNVYEYGIVVSSTIVYLMFIVRKDCNVSTIMNYFPIILFWLVYILSTLLVKTNELLYTGRRAYSMIAILLFIDMEIRRNTRITLKLLALFYTTYVLLNNILVVFFPEGCFKVTTSLTHKGHLLGDDNAIIYVALPGMLFLVIYSLYEYGRITKFTWFNLILCEFVFVRLWAGSAFVCFFMFIVILYFSVSKCVLTIRPLLIFACIGFCAYIIFASSVKNNVFGDGLISGFITSFLGKDLTFSNRSFMWENALGLIKEKPLLGYGGYYQAGIYISKGGITYPCHTPYLQFLLDGGIILFSSFVTWVLFIAKKLSKTKNNSYSRAITAALIAIFISYIFEYTQMYHVMIICALAINISYLSKNNTRNDFA